MVTEEDIHRYHMSERVYGVPLPPCASLGDVGQSSKGAIMDIGNSRVRIVLSISPPSSPPSPPIATSQIQGGTTYTNQMELGEGSTVPTKTKSKSKKRKSDVQEMKEGYGIIVDDTSIDDRKDKKVKKDKKDRKETKEKKDKKEKKHVSTAPGDLFEQDNARTPIPPPAIASTSTITPLQTEAKKSKKEKKPKSTTQANGAESSTIKMKKQKKPKPTASHPVPVPGPSTSTPGMGGPDELSSDEADIFEIDELLPSSPVLQSPPLPSTSTSQIISQPTPTPKPRKKRVSDSSGFDTPSAPEHLRHPFSNVAVGESTPSRLGRMGGTPIKKALVRLGASWVTSTPVPK